MKRDSLKVVVCALLLAMTVVISPFPYVFLIPVLFAACCFGFGMSFYSSAIFGLVSLIYTMLAGSGTPVGYYFFHYPWIPLVPRLFVGVIAHATFRLMQKLFKNKGAAGKVLPISITAVVGSLSNTLLVGGCILLVNSMNGLTLIVLADLVIAGSIEIAVTAIILPPIVLGVKRAMPRLFGEINSKTVKTKTQQTQKAQQTQQNTQAAQVQQAQPALCEAGIDAKAGLNATGSDCQGEGK